MTYWIISHDTVTVCTIVIYNIIKPFLLREEDTSDRKKWKQEISNGKNWRTRRGKKEVQTEEAEEGVKEKEGNKEMKTEKEGIK